MLYTTVKLFIKFILSSLILCTVSMQIKANDYSKGELAFHNNQFFKSEIYFRNASNFFIREKLPYQAANTINRLGENLRILGKEKEAEQILIQNESRILKLPNHSLLLAQCYDVLGELKYYISDVEQAGYYFKKSLAFKKNILKENDADLALSYSNLGRYYNFTQQLDSAIFFTKIAYLIIKGHPANNNYVNFEKIYCEYAYAEKEKIVDKNKQDWYNSTLVRPILEEALKYNQHNYRKPNYWLAVVLHSIGNTYTDEVKTTMESKSEVDKRPAVLYYQKALNYYSNAIKIYKSLIPEENPRLSMTYYVSGLVHTYYGADPKLALIDYQKAIQQIIPQTDTIHYLTLPVLKESPYNIHQYLSLISYKIDAINKLNKGSIGVIYDKIILSYTDNLIVVWAELINNYKLNSNKDITTYYFKLPYGVALDVCISLYGKTKNKKYLGKALFYIELSKYSAFFKQRMSSTLHVELFLKSAKEKSLDIHKIQQTILPNEAIWEIYDDIDAIYTLTIIRNDAQLRRIPISKSDIENFELLSKADRLSYNNYKALAFSTFLRLGLNSSIFNNVKNINIIPGVTFSYNIPFVGLTSSLKGGSYKTLDYLIYKFNFHYSLSILIATQFNRPNVKSSDFEILYSSPSSLSPLPFTKNMVNEMKSNYKAKLVNSNQPLKNILNDFNNQNLVHIAAHTIINKNNPDESYIVLDNQHLKITEIYKYSTNANLISLGSCETTIGKSIPEAGSVLNFVRAFTYAGANSLTSTLWKVDDEMTSKIYKDFYSGLYNHENKMNALHIAQINYINKAVTDAANPYYWAGIILYGNIMPINLQCK